MPNNHYIQNRYEGVLYRPSVPHKFSSQLFLWQILGLTPFFFVLAAIGLAKESNHVYLFVVGFVFCMRSSSVSNAYAYILSATSPHFTY